MKLRINPSLKWGANKYQKFIENLALKKSFEYASKKIRGNNVPINQPVIPKKNERGIINNEQTDLMFVSLLYVEKSPSDDVLVTLKLIKKFNGMTRKKIKVRNAEPNLIKYTKDNKNEIALEKSKPKFITA